MKNFNQRAWLVSNPNLWNWGRDIQIKLLQEKLNLQKSNYLLDFGCGVLRGGIHIIDYLDSGHYYGIEKDNIRLDEAKLELADNNLEHKLPILGNDFSIVDKLIDVIWCWEVFIHLEDNILDESIKKMSRLMKNSSKIYSTVNITTEYMEDGRWHEYPVKYKNLSFYENIANKHNLKIHIMSAIGNGEHNFTHTHLIWTKGV